MWVAPGPAPTLGAGLSIPSGEEGRAEVADFLSLRASFDALRRESREAAAMAFALGRMHVPDGNNTALTISLGQFGGEGALAAQGLFRFPGEPDLTVQFGATHGMQYKQTGVVAGFSLSW